MVTQPKESEGFGRRLREARERQRHKSGRRWSQDDLAEALGVAKNTVSEWERGRPPRDLAILPRIAEALGVDVSWLLGEDQPENGQPPATSLSSRPIARAMGVIDPTSELHFTSTTACQEAHVWLLGFLRELEDAGADEPFLESARRLLLSPANYSPGFGTTAGQRHGMDDAAMLRHMQALAMGVRAALKDRQKKGKGR